MKARRFFAAAIVCGAALAAGGVAYGADSVFDVTDAEDGSYDGKVKIQNGLVISIR